MGKKLVVDISGHTHKILKKVCVEHDVTMKVVITYLIEDFLDSERITRVCDNLRKAADEK